MSGLPVESVKWRWHSWPACKVKDKCLHVTWLRRMQHAEISEEHHIDCSSVLGLYASQCFHHYMLHPRWCDLACSLKKSPATANRSCQDASFGKPEDLLNEMLHWEWTGENWSKDGGIWRFQGSEKKKEDAKKQSETFSPNLVHVHLLKCSKWAVLFLTSFTVDPFP